MRDRIGLLSFLWIFIASFPVRAEDVPNAHLEDKLYSTYKIQAAEPTDENLWFVVRGSAGAMSYKTQKGDTLADVSEMLFGDRNFWPKIWALNAREVWDPHNLKPGTILTFAPTGAAEPPMLGVDNSGEKEEVPPDVLALFLGAEIPPPLRRSLTPIKELPGSVPFWKYKRDRSQNIIFEVTKLRRDFPPPETVLSHYVVEQDLPSLGEVTGTEMGLNSGADFQYIFVRTDNMDTRNLLAVKEIGQIVDGSRKASVVAVEGEVELLESVDEEKGIRRALVKKVFQPVEKGASLIAGSVPMVTAEASMTTAKVDSRIVGGQFSGDRQLFASNTVVFLNSGSQEGLAVGQTLPIYRAQSERTDENPVKQAPRKIGRLKVVKVSEHFSTAVVVEAREDVHSGDGTSAESVLR